MASFQELVIKLKADVKGALTSLDLVDKKAKAMGTGLKGALDGAAKSLGGWPVVIGGATVALTAATAGAVAFGTASFKAYNESVNVIHEMEAVLKSTGKLSDGLSSKLQENADILQSQTLFGDEDILKATSRIANLTKLIGPELVTAQKGVVQLATKLKVDLPTAATIMSKAVAGNMGALGRYGLKLEDTGTAAGNLAAIMTATASGWDQARAAVDTFSGRLSQFSKYWGEILEKVGAVVAIFANYLLKNNEVKAAVEALANSTKNVNDWMEKHKDLLNKVAESMADVLISVGSLIRSLGNLAGAFLGTATNTGKAQTTGDKFADALDAIKKAAQGIKDILDGITRAVNAVAGAFNTATGAANGLTGAYERQKTAGRGLNAAGIAGAFTKAGMQSPSDRVKESTAQMKKLGLGWMIGGHAAPLDATGPSPMVKMLDVMNKLEAKTKDLTEAESYRLKVLKEALTPAMDLGDQFFVLHKMYQEGLLFTNDYNRELEVLKESLGVSDGLIKTSNDLKTLSSLFSAGLLTVKEYTKGYREILNLSTGFTPDSAMLKAGDAGGIKNANSLFNLGGLVGDSVRAGSLQAATTGLSQLKTTGNDTMSSLEQAARGFGDNFAQIFEQAVLTGKLNFGDLAKSILADLAKIILQITVIKPISNMFSNLLGGLFSGLTGGFGAGNVSSGFKAAFGGFKAEGGPVMPGKAYIVGERGPELFSPGSAGNITPSHRIQGNSQGGVTVIMNNNFALGVTETVRQQIAAEMPNIAKASAAAVSAEIGRGGTLARQVGARR